MKSIFVCVAVVMSFYSMSSQAKDHQPGFRVMITEKGLNYAHHVGLLLLEEWVCNYTIPDYNLTSQFGLANISYSFSNITIHSLDYGESSLTSVPEGLVLSVHGAGASFSTNWTIEEEDWPHFTDCGSASFSADGISISITTEILMSNGSNEGHFVLNAVDCSFSINDVDVVFSGGSSYFYNMFGLAINDFLKHELKKETCSQLMDWINNSGNDYVESLPVVLNLKHGSGVEISYALVRNASFIPQGRVVTDHRGEFLVHAHPKDPPITPPPLPDPAHPSFSGDKMVHIIATTYVAESASYAFWKAGLMKYNICSEQLGPFKTTKYWCRLVSQTLCDKYPNKKVKFGINATSYPGLVVSEDGALMNAAANGSMYVDNDGKMELAFTLELIVTADAHPRLDRKDQQYVLCGNVTNPKVKISLGKSNIGHFNCSKLQDIIEDIVIPVGISFINEYTTKGVPIPSMDGVSLHNVTLHLGKGCIMFGTDVQYNRESNMTCIYDT